MRPWYSALPFPTPDGISGRHLANIHNSRLSTFETQKLRAFTVAGQWRNFTALPEHSITGQRWTLHDRRYAASRRKWVRFKL